MGVESDREGGDPEEDDPERGDGDDGDSASTADGSTDRHGDDTASGRRARGRGGRADSTGRDDGSGQASRGDDGSEQTNRDDGGGPRSRIERRQRVHVRRLTVVDTLRWSWAVLRQRPSLIGLALAATLPSVLTTAGVSRPTPGAPPEVAEWVASVYLTQLLAVAVVSGAVYLTAADAVANRTRPLSAHLRTAVGVLPQLFATGVAVVVLAGVSLVPATLAFALGWPYSLVGLALLVLPVYAFYRLLLAFPAAVVDDRGPFASSRDGWRAATGIVRKVFAVGVVYVLAVSASNVVAGLFGGQYDVASTLVSAAIGAVVLPFFGLALAHLYLEGSRNR